VFTFDRILDPKANVLVRAYFSLWLKQVKKVDDKNVEFVLNFPFAYALQRIQIAKIMPKHVFDGKWDDAKGGKVVGSGPYKVTEQAALSHTSFEKFADYNGPRPAVYKTMLWKSIVDAAPRVASISGASPEAQIVDNIPAENVDALKKAGRTVDLADGMNNLWLMFNTKHAPFDNKLVRQALHYAIDGKQMVAIGLKGAGTPATSFINPALPSSQPASENFSYDPAKAKQLLQQAGITNMKVTLNSSNTSLVASCVNVIKAGWDAIGVQTTLNTADTKALFSKLDGGADFQVVASTGNPEQFGIDPDLLIRSYYGPDSLWSKTYARWDSADAQALYALQDQAAKEPDETKRNQLVKQLLDQLSEQAVFYPVVFTKLGTAWDPKKISDVKAQGYPGINVLQVKTV
jgi:peptide/nickel transport system substrate-binding protein